MAKRKRDMPLLFWVSPEEKALIQKKMEQIGTTNLSAYLRKMAIDGYAVNLDLPELRELVSLLRRSSNNLNQLTVMARQGRITQVNYEPFTEVYRNAWQTLNSLLSHAV